MKLAPIVLFTYNRPSHTKQTVDALLKNDLAPESELIIYSDGIKNEASRAGVEETQHYLKSIEGFKSVRIIERTVNLGLAKNIIDGVTQIFSEYDRIIVLEDDLLTSPYFLKYMNEALNKYEEIETVISVHGYIYPINKSLPEAFFIKGADCLGWGTWKRGWNLFNNDGKTLLNEIQSKGLEHEFDFEGSYPYTAMLKDQSEGKVGSWAIRWYASAFLLNKLTLYPGRSLVFHNGSDGSGTNCDVGDEFEVELSKTPILLDNIEVAENKTAQKAFVHYFRYTLRFRRLKAGFNRLLNRFQS